MWYVCDLIRTQCHLWSHDTWSLYCALQCIVHCVWQSSWICCPDLFEALQVIFLLVFQIITRWGRWQDDALEAVSPGHFVGIGQGVCLAPWSQTMRSGSKNKIQYSIIGAVDSSIRWALLEIGWPEWINFPDSAVVVIVWAIVVFFNSYNDSWSPQPHTGRHHIWLRDVWQCYFSKHCIVAYMSGLPGTFAVGYTLKFQTKVKWRFAKISQSRRRPLLRPRG